MKKSIFILLVVILPLRAFSQISKGSIIVGGEFSLSVSKNKTEQGSNTDNGPTRTNFTLIPNIEYFIADNLSAGIGLGYSMSKVKTELSNSETTQKDGTFIISPYLKKYFSLGDKAYFFGEAVVNLGYGKETNDYKSGNVTTSVIKDHNSFGVGILPGFRYDVSEKISLETEIGFIGFTSNVDKTGSGNSEKRDISNTFQFNFFPNTIMFGIKYKL